MNLKDETLESMAEVGKSASDIAWIGCVDFEIPQELFWELADAGYDCGYGVPEVAKDIMIVFRDGAWLERAEYDGSEWWDYRAMPVRPAEIKDDIEHLTVCGTDKVGWETLASLNESDSLGGES